MMRFIPQNIVMQKNEKTQTFEVFFPDRQIYKYTKMATKGDSVSTDATFRGAQCTRMIK